MLFTTPRIHDGSGELRQGQLDYYPRRPLSAEDSEDFIILDGLIVAGQHAPSFWLSDTKKSLPVY